ncbi:hypothetical protein LINPERHAP2_LOCUS34536, partial [Linum perenne]
LEANTYIPKEGSGKKSIGPQPNIAIDKVDIGESLSQ